VAISLMQRRQWLLKAESDEMRTLEKKYNVKRIVEVFPGEEQAEDIPQIEPERQKIPPQPRLQTTRPLKKMDTARTTVFKDNERAVDAETQAIKSSHDQDLEPMETSVIKK
jgi:hypothetical protein